MSQVQKVVIFLDTPQRAQQMQVLLQLSSFKREMNYFLGITNPKNYERLWEHPLNHVPSSLEKLLQCLCICGLHMSQLNEDWS